MFVESIGHPWSLLLNGITHQGTVMPTEDPAVDMKNFPCETNQRKEMTTAPFNATSHWFY